MKKILFVCTGNTCRSPMAQAIFDHLAPDGFCSNSAGITTSPGKPVSENSLIALSQLGISCKHSSLPLSSQLMNEYDYVVGITADHAKIISAIFPEYKDKVFAFPADVSDPYGRNLSEYIKCRDMIYDGVQKIIGEICHE